MTRPRPGLTPVLIVESAIALLDAEGADAFSMRKLGTHLGVDPMAVYHYFPNKTALFDGIVDATWAQLAFWEPQDTDSWQATVADVFRHLRQRLLKHPGTVPVIAIRPLASPYMLHLANRVIGHLDSQGLPPASAMMLLDCTLAYTVGKVVGEVREHGRDRGNAGVEKITSALPLDELPHFATALPTGYGWAPDEEFERGLVALVNGWADS